MPTLIRETARAGAGEADLISVQAFGPGEVLTALRNVTDPRAPSMPLKVTNIRDVKQVL